MRSFFISSLLASGLAATPCINGNQCANDQVCLGDRSLDSLPAGALFGRKHGCAPALVGPEPVVCPGGSFSCSKGEVCVQGEGDIMSCAPTATANATSVATMNADSTLRPEFEVRESDVCSYVIDDLPYGCSCENNGKYGGLMDCTYDVYVTKLGLKGNFQPCIAPAEMSLEIYESTIGFSYPIGVTMGQTLAEVPIPGLSVGMPSPFPAAGIFASFKMSGTIASLSFSGQLDACATAPWPIGKKCGSGLGVPGLPVKVFTFSESFSSVCDDYNKTAVSLRGRA